jgi:hypothetical protein
MVGASLTAFTLIVKDLVEERPNPSVTVMPMIAEPFALGAGVMIAFLLAPEPLRVGEHREKWHHSRQAHDLGKAARQHRGEHGHELNPPFGREVAPEAAEERDERWMVVHREAAPA